jgi:hypothetical protein
MILVMCCATTPRQPPHRDDHSCQHTKPDHTQSAVKSSKENRMAGIIPRHIPRQHTRDTSFELCAKQTANFPHKSSLSPQIRFPEIQPQTQCLFSKLRSRGQMQTSQRRHPHRTSMPEKMRPRNRQKERAERKSLSPCNSDRSEKFHRIP